MEPACERAERGWSLQLCRPLVTRGTVLFCGVVTIAAIACGSTTTGATDDVGDSSPAPRQETAPITLGGSLDDEGVSVVPLGNGGWLVVGNTRSYGEGETDIWLVKLDSSFAVEWDRTVGTAQDDRAWNAVSDGEGGVLIAGHSDTRAEGTGDLVLIRTSGNGEVLWYRTYDIPGVQGRGFVQQVGTDGYALSGWSTPEDSLTDFILVRTDNEGELLWYRTYGGDGMNGANSFRVTGDSGFVLYGEGLWGGGNDYEIWQGILVRTDAMGNILWHREFGMDGPEEGYALALSNDGCFLAGGFSRNAAHRGGYLLKANSNGEQQWWRQFDTPVVVSQIEASEDGYLLVGAGGVRKVDENGDSIWAHHYPQLGWIHSIVVRPDTGIILVGSAPGTAGDGNDVALLLTDLHGNPG